MALPAQNQEHVHLHIHMPGSTIYQPGSTVYMPGSVIQPQLLARLLRGNAQATPNAAPAQVVPNQNVPAAPQEAARNEDERAKDRKMGPIGLILGISILVFGIFAMLGRIPPTPVAIVAYVTGGITVLGAGVLFLEKDISAGIGVTLAALSFFALSVLTQYQFIAPQALGGVYSLLGFITVAGMISILYSACKAHSTPV